MPIKEPEKPSKKDRLKFLAMMAKKHQDLLDKIEEEKTKVETE